MAEANIKINIQDASIKELNEEIARLTEELEGTSRATEEGRKRIAALGSEINNLQGEVAGIEQSLKKVDVGQLVGEIGKVAAGLGAAGVALSSFGADNEQVQETLEKTNAILGLAAAAEALYTLTNKEGAIAVAANAVATNTAAAAQAAYTAVIGTSTGALKLFRLALVATGIGAIVVGIGLLVANWEKLSKAFKDSEGNLTNFGKIILFILGPIGLIILGLDKIAKSVGGWDNLFAAISGVIKAFFTNFSEIFANVGEILAGVFTLDLDRIKAGIAAGKKILVDGAQQSVAEAEAARAKAQELENAKANQSLLDYEAEKARILGKSRKDIYNAERAAAKNSLRAAELEFGKNSEEYRKAELALLKITEDYNAAIKAERDKADEERKAKAKETADALLDAERQLRQKTLELFNLSEAEKLKAIDDNLKAELEANKKAAKSLQELQARNTTSEITAAAAKVKIFEETQQEELRLAKEALDARLEFLKIQAEATGDVEGIKAIQEQAAAAQLAYDQTSADITAKAQASIKAINVTGAEGQRIIQEALTQTSQVSTEFNTEVTRATGETLNEITGIATEAAFNATFQTLEVTKQLIDQTYQEIATKGNKFFLGQAKLRERAEIEAAKKIAQANIERINEEIKRIQDLETQQEANSQKRIKEIKEQRDKTLEALNDESLTLEERLVLQTRLAQQEADLAREEQTRSQAKINNENEIIDLIKQRGEEEEIAAGKAKSAYETALGDIKDFLEGPFAEVVGSVTDLLSARLEFINQKISGVGSTYDALIERDTAFYDEQIALAEGNAEEIARLEEAKAQSILALEAEKNNKIADLQIKAARTQFALDIGSIITNGALAVTKALAAGPILGPILAAIALASVGFQIATAKSARDQAIAEANSLRGGSAGGGSVSARTQFAQGGFVSGPGTATSDSIPARLSNGEFVVNARSTAQYLPLLEQINNRPQGFATSGPVTNTALQASNSTVILNRMIPTLQNIDNTLKKPLKAYVVQSELDQSTESQQYLERRAELT